MRSHLLDLVHHTHDLGCIDLIKVTGTDKETTVTGIAEDRSVVLDAVFAKPIPEFIGNFGMPNLSKLKILLHLEEYLENVKMTVTTNGPGVLDGIDFENAAGDFFNTYRFMSQQIVNDKLKTVTFKGATWHVEFVPAAASILRFKMQEQANVEETTFQVRTANNELKFFFGDHSTHAGNFVFQQNITGQLKRAWSWPIKTVSSIFNLTGDKAMKISDDGVAKITVDSGLAVYNYLLPAQSK